VWLDFLIFMEVSGILTKRGSQLKTWRRRHFQLKYNNLSYYAYDGGPLKGEYVIDEHTTVHTSNLRKNAFSLVQQNGRTLVMFADTALERDMWMDAFQVVIEKLRKDAGIAPIHKSGGTQSTIPEENIEIESQYHIFIHVIQARNLFAKGSTDTCAKVYVGDKMQSTQIAKRELNPIWDEMFTFAWSPELRYARIEVWDNDAMLSARDNFLGVVRIPLLLLHASSIPLWHQLGKRTSRSHVSGDIKIFASSDRPVDTNVMKLLEEMWSVAEIGHVVSKISLPCLSEDVNSPPQLLESNSTPVDCPLISSDIPAPNPAVTHTSLNVDGVPPDITTSPPTQSAEATFVPLHQRFPFAFPPRETEILHDVSMMVTLKPTLDKGPCSVFSDGILLLTNYRLVFLAHSRLLFGSDEIRNLHRSGRDTLQSELTCSIPLASIVHVGTQSDYDPHVHASTRTQLDAITIKTNDARVCLLIINSSRFLITVYLSLGFFYYIS
jgi:hypothetical protein